MTRITSEVGLAEFTKQKSNPVPRYREITHILLNEIRTGEYTQNMRFPTEAQLSERFNVSRFTVREALRAIEEMGLISRRPGAGTTVEATEVDGRFANSINSIDDLLQYARTTRFDVRSVSTVNSSRKFSAKIGCAVEGKWQKIVGVRMTEDERRPICRTEIYLPVRLQKIVPAIGTRPVAVYQMIEDTFGPRHRNNRAGNRGGRFEPAGGQSIWRQPRQPGPSHCAALLYGGAPAHRSRRQPPSSRCVSICHDPASRGCP